MIDNITFSYITQDAEHIISVCEKMREYDRGDEIYHLTAKGKSNPLYPMRVVCHHTNRVEVSGSIHKFWNKTDHCNDSNFSLSNAADALKQICKVLKIDLSVENPKITKIELGVNIKLSMPVLDFLKLVGTYKSRNFSYSKPLSSTSRKWGKELRMADYDLKFYDKSYTTNKELHYKKYPNENLLRFEMALKNHVKRYLKFDTINDLLKNLSAVPEVLKATIEDIYFKSSFNYEELTIDEIFLCEGIKSDELSTNIQGLSKNKKLQIQRRRIRLISKFQKSNYSKTVKIRLVRKIRFLEKT